MVGVKVEGVPAHVMLSSIRDVVLESDLLEAVVRTELALPSKKNASLVMTWWMKSSKIRAIDHSREVANAFMPSELSSKLNQLVVV